MRNILRSGVVSLQEVEGDRKDAVLVSLEDATLRLGVTMPAALEDIGVGLRLCHEWDPHCY
jgi:hypothetical protein